MPISTKIIKLLVILLLRFQFRAMFQNNRRTVGLN